LSTFPRKVFYFDLTDNRLEVTLTIGEEITGQEMFYVKSEKLFMEEEGTI